MFSPQKIHLPAPIFVLITGVVLFFFWENMLTEAYLPAKFKAELRVPADTDMPEKNGVTQAAAAEIETFFTPGPGKPSAEVTGTWSRFRGDHLDHISRDKTPLDIPVAGQPPVLWEISAGEGYAGAAVYGGCAYILDYDMEKLQDALRCISMDDGREIWRVSYEIKILRNHGMSRTIPAVCEEFIVTLGPKCHAMCVERKTGKLRWIYDLRGKYGVTVPEWYAGQCPVIVNPPGENPRVILAVGGPEALLVSLDCATGEEIWRTPNPRNWQMTHASLTPMNLDGRGTWVYPCMRGIVGVAADTGEILWEETTWKGIHAMCPAPVVLSSDRVFCAGSYNAGSMMLTIRKNPSPSAENPYPYVTVPEFWHFRKFSSMQQTPILYGEFLLGVRESDKQLVCFDLSGKELWAGGVQNRFGWGPYLFAGGKMFLLNDSGTLTVGEVSAAGFTRLARYEIFEDGVDSWAPMTVVDGRLILRDLTRMKCLDFRKK